MDTNDELHGQRQSILNALKTSWRELDEAREQWLNDPLNPNHPDRIRELGTRADKLGDEFTRVSVRLYGSWYGIDE